MKLKIAEGILYINGQRRKLNSYKKLPAHFRDEIMPLAQFYYRKDPLWTVLTQKAKLGLFSIVTHYVKPGRDMVIIPSLISG